MALIVRYEDANGPTYGLLIDDIVHAWTDDPFASQSYTPGPAIGPLVSVRLLAPVTPSKIVCVGRNYAAHAAEHHADVPEEPMLFLKPPSAIVGPGTPIEIPVGSGRVDHEAELAVIIGTETRQVSHEDALSHVLGYTCANDVSARDFQKKDGQWGRAKGFDTFCPLGPWINTAIDPGDCAVRCLVNGDMRQDSRTSNMVFDVPTLIAFISQVMTLSPGDVILTGTPEGVNPVQPGDTVEVTVEGCGVLRNPVVQRP